MSLSRILITTFFAAVAAVGTVIAVPAFSQPHHPPPRPEWQEPDPGPAVDMYYDGFAHRAGHYSGTVVDHIIETDTRFFATGPTITGSPQAFAGLLGQCEQDGCYVLTVQDGTGNKTGVQVTETVWSRCWNFEAYPACAGAA